MEQKFCLLVACKAELTVRTAEVCEKVGRDFIYTNGLKRGVPGTATYVVCENNPLIFKAACKNGVNCAFHVKAGWRNSQADDGVWCVDSVVEHDCPAARNATDASINREVCKCRRARARCWQRQHCLGDTHKRLVQCAL